MADAPVFGKEITAKEGKILMNHFWDIKAAAIKQLTSALATASDDVKRYYCGREKQDPLEEDIAYVFTNEILRKMMIEAEKASGLVMFNAARFTEDGTNDVSGRPTLVIFPFTFKDTSDMQKSVIEIAATVTTAYEHPGTGTKPSGSILQAESINVDVHPIF